MSMLDAIRRIIGLTSDEPPPQSRSRAPGVRRGHWKRSPTKHYARVGPHRGACVGATERPSRQVRAKGTCACKRPAVAKRIDGPFRLDDKRRVCTRCHMERAKAKGVAS